ESQLQQNVQRSDTQRSGNQRPASLASNATAATATSALSSLTVIVPSPAGGTVSFPLNFVSGKASPEEIVGTLARPEWAAQRGWGYKQVRADPGSFSIKYAAREKDIGANKGAGKVGVLSFTIFFTTMPLYRSASEAYTLKSNDLHPATFRSHFVNSLSRTVDTEWACITPPDDCIVPTTGDLCLAYVCKPVNEPVGEMARQRVTNWVAANLARGDW
ncbi:hypothetical protein HDU93_005760, partial [Gonapodya sp. JEL0774]